MPPHVGPGPRRVVIKAEDRPARRPRAAGQPRSSSPICGIRQRFIRADLLCPRLTSRIDQRATTGSRSVGPAAVASGRSTARTVFTAAAYVLMQDSGCRHRLCSHPGVAAGPADRTVGTTPAPRCAASSSTCRPPPRTSTSWRHIALRARRPPRLARTFAPPSRVTGLRETAHGGAVRQAARNGPSSPIFRPTWPALTAATSDPSFY